MMDARANQFMDLIWPALKEAIYRDLCYRKVVQPTELLPLQTFMPWDWDTRDCLRCARLVCTAVAKPLQHWTGPNFCYACEKLLTQSQA